MKPIVEKVLRSGLVDKATAQMMESMGLLPEGASDVVDEDGLKGKTKEQLMSFAETIAVEVEREHKVRESFLDLDRLKWPATVVVSSTEEGYSSRVLTAMVDRQGRYYFRVQDSEDVKFTPGFTLRRGDTPFPETILESQVLYVEDEPMCIQVSTTK